MRKLFVIDNRKAREVAGDNLGEFFYKCLAGAKWFVGNELVRRIGEAILEVLCVGLLGLAPLFAASFLKSDTTAGLASASLDFWGLISLGQLYLYAFSLIGTLLWLLIARSNGAHLLIRSLIAILIVFISVSCMSVYMQNPSMTEKLPSHLIAFSLLCFFLCIAMYFVLLLCASAKVPLPSDTLDSEVRGLVSRAEGRGK